MFSSPGVFHAITGNSRPTISYFTYAVDNIISLTGLLPYESHGKQAYQNWVVVTKCIKLLKILHCLNIYNTSHVCCEELLCTSLTGEIFSDYPTTCFHSNLKEVGG